MSIHSRLIAWAAFGLTAGSLAAYATPAGAQNPAQGQPPGSYAQSCSVETAAGGYLSGYCRTDDGGQRWSSIRYADCYGDISNRNGVLTCRGATATEGPYYPPETRASPTGEQIFGAIAGAILGQVLGQAPDGQGLYQDGYRYPEYGQSGYGDPRHDPRYGQEGWGYGRDRQWVPIVDRGAWFERRIETGRRQSRLSEREVSTLRIEFQALVRLERDYGRGGLTNRERGELDRRFDQLAARVRIERRDDDWRDDDRRDDEWGEEAWRSMSERRSAFDQAVSRGLADRRLSRREAETLRRDFEALIRQETDFNRDGLDRYERQSLNSRYDDLLGRTGVETGGGAWVSVADRAGHLERAIDEGARAGRISRREADRLRADLTALLRLEADYRRNGLTQGEREELDRRHGDLAARAGASTGGGGASDGPAASQRADLTARIDRAERDRRIGRSEATRLRAELDDLLRLEEGYASDGLNESERSYLRYRLDALAVLVPR